MRSILCEYWKVTIVRTFNEYTRLIFLMVYLLFIAYFAQIQPSMGLEVL